MGVRGYEYHDFGGVTSEHQYLPSVLLLRIQFKLSNALILYTLCFLSNAIAVTR